MKKMKITTLKLLVIGLIICVIGAFFKIQKAEFSNIILLIGIGFEITALLYYFYKKRKSNVA
jgi:hypothetical protein